jgi:predicted nucleic acid-binding protein
VIQIDTSFLIRALIEGTAEDRLLRRWLAERKPLAVSAIVWTEFLCGPLRTREIQLAAQVVGPVLPYGPDEAAVASELFNLGGRRRGSLVDCMVAASAICQGAALATSNPGDFSRFTARGLEVYQPTGRR